MNKQASFFGTYFDREVVLRLERFVRIVAWGTLIIYVVESGYNLYQSIYNWILNGFTPDAYIFISVISRVMQGAAIFALLYVFAAMLLILLDIEDNTRRAARGDAKQS